MKVIMNFECPKCRCEAKAELDYSYKFLIYKCPECHSNVVYYDNRLDVISDRMIDLLKKKRKLRLCRNTLSKTSKKKINKIRSEEITADSIVDLKILLETEKDVGQFLSKI